MMRFYRHAALFAASLGVAACQQGASRPALAPMPVAVANADGFPLEIGSLPAQELAVGSCGLFLWTKGAEPQLVFVSDSRSPTARMVLDGEIRTLQRTSAEGAGGYGQFVRQSFTSGETVIALGFEPEARPGLVDGAAVPRGALRLTDGEGWDMVLPVAGLIACKPK